MRPKEEDPVPLPAQDEEKNEVTVQKEQEEAEAGSEPTKKVKVDWFSIYIPLYRELYTEINLMKHEICKSRWYLTNKQSHLHCFALHQLVELLLLTLFLLLLLLLRRQTPQPRLFLSQFLLLFFTHLLIMLLQLLLLLRLIVDLSRLQRLRLRSSAYLQHSDLIGQIKG